MRSSGLRAKGIKNSQKVSYINSLGQRGMEMQSAIREGAADRLRPVLITALVASIGFLPMAISTETGAEIQRPLATVVIGGLVTSTLLTLYILPLLYPWFTPKAIASSQRRCIGH
jgi:cobalt-zinc-cadmium resistance protein CzcA